MGGDVLEIPLFPLNVVLFPGMALPLHIFEPRYRQMTCECLDSQMPMGIVLALPDSTTGREHPARVGTCARITDYKRLDDGRYNLLTVGTERFEVLEVHYDKQPYIVGTVRLLRDIPDAGDLAQLVADASTLLDTYLRAVLELLGTADSCAITIPTDAEDLSYLIAMCIAGEDSEKQRLLELTSVRARLEEGLELLGNEIESLAEQRATSGTSGAGDDHTLLN